MYSSRLYKLATGRVAAVLVVRLISVGSALLLNILLARYLGPEGFGSVAFTLAWLLLMSGLVRHGLGIFMVREVAALRARKEFALLRGFLKRTFQYVLLSSAVISLIIFAVLKFVGSSLESVQYNLFLYGIPMILLLGLLSYYEAIMKGFGYIIRSQLAEFVVRPVFQLTIIIALVFHILPFGFHPTSVIIVYSLGALLACIVAYMLRVKIKRSALTTSRYLYRTKDWFKAGLNLSVVSWVGLLNLHVIPIMLGLLGSNKDVAFFQAAAQLAFALSIITMVLNAVQAADFSKYYALKDSKKIQSLATKSSRICCAFSLCWLVIYFVFGERFIELILGEQYEGLYPILMIISLANFINTTTGSLGVLMNSCHQEKEVYIALLLALTLGIIAGLIFIPPYGAMGGGIAMAASLASWNIFLIIRAKQKLNIWCLPFLFSK